MNRTKSDMVAQAQLVRDRCAQLEELEDKVDYVLTKTVFKSAQLPREFLALLRLVQELQPRYLCEIGASFGGTLLLAQIAAPDAQLLSIDKQHTAQSAEFVGTFARERQKITCLSADSSRSETVTFVQEWLAANRLDLLFIDGDHSLPGVRRDFQLYAPMVRHGGLVGLHDIIPDSRTRYGIQTSSDTGDVPRYWRQLKTEFPIVDILELVDDPEQDGFGIGVIRMGDLRMAQSKPLDLSTLIIRSENSIFAEAEDETVMLNLETNSYYGLDPIASRIWELVAQPTSIADICAKLQQEYDVDADTCRQDVVELLNDLIAEQLVETVDT